MGLRFTFSKDSKQEASVAEAISKGKNVSGLGNEVTDLSSSQITENLQASMKSLDTF